MDAVTVDNKSSADDNYDEDAFAVFDSLDKSDSISECSEAIVLNSTRETNESLATPTNVNTQTINQHTQQALRGDDSYNIIKHNKLTEKQQKQRKEELKEISHDNGITVLSCVNKIENDDDSKENGYSNSHNITHTNSSKDISCSNNVNKIGQIKLEKNSNIRVKRCTRSFDQLPVLLAQYPFATFSQLRLLSKKCYNDTSNTSFSYGNNKNNSTLARCCVGVVSYRGEPKQNHKSTSHSTFAVIRIWNMHGFSPSSSEELALLLCSSAFDILYSQLMLGSVIAVVNLSLLSSSSSSSSSPHHANNIGTSNTKHDGLYRVHDIEQIRLLGYSAELGTCSAISKNSQERCHNLVNTHISQYCMYHLNEVKKVARGATGVNVNKTVTTNINNNNKNNISAITSNQSSYVFVHNQRTPIIPATTSSSSSLQPLNVSRQQSSASRTAILKQPSFLIVKGNNGLPVHSPATQHRMNVGGNNNIDSEDTNNNNMHENKMYGEGIYAGVCKGSALSINKKINSSLVPNAHDKTLHANNSVSNNSLNTHNTLYPATSVHNITTRGRDVLAIAQQQENAQQQARLLRSALCTTTSSVKNNRNFNNDKKSVSNQNKAMLTNLHVATNGEHNLPSSSIEQRSAKRVRADDSVQLSESERRKRNTTKIESENMEIKRNSDEEKVKNRTHRSSESELISKSAYPSRQTVKSYHKINDELIRAVKEQCAPLTSTPLASSSELNNLSSNVYFVPEAKSMERVELVIDYQHTNSNDSNKQEANNKNMGSENVNRRKCNSANAKKQIITQTLSGHRSALVNTVAKAIRNKVILPSSTSSSCSTSQLLNTQQEKQLRQEEEAEKPHLQQETSSPFGLVINSNKNSNNNSTAITLLGEIASQMHSAHDSLRNEAEINRLNAQLDKSIAQEKAIALLSSIHEQPIDATYCYQCNS